MAAPIAWDVASSKVKDRTTKSGESWADLNKRRGRLSAAGADMGLAKN